MTRKLKAVPTNGHDIEKLAAEAKVKRQSECTEAINKVLSDHNCQLVVLVQTGNVAIQLERVLALPAMIQAISK